MSFWILMTMLCSAAAVGISIPLIRRLDSANHGGARQAAIYEDQLKEIDRDLQSGTINGPEAESAKLEIQRRLASAIKNIPDARPISSAWRNVALLAASGLVIVGGVTLYDKLGSPDLPSASPAQPSANAVNTSTQIDAAIPKLVAQLKFNPDDAEGWRMLGLSQFSLQRYQEAVDAYAKALALDPANSEYKSVYAEALALAAQGVVTPKAQQLIAEVLAKEPKNARARFYDALAHEQSGDQTGALDRWESLYTDAPPDAPWRDEVKQRLTSLAQATGSDTTTPVITDEQKAEIQAMSAEDRKAMIASMVEGLATKLANNPNDLDGWIRLMRSYKMMNEGGKAKDAMTKALAAFSNDPGSLDKIKAATAELGIE
jgi:cytochrome c-type biogenesis protein CcmH